MIALIKTGGKQYKVKAGDKLTIEKIGDADTKEIIFDEILMISDGKPVFGAPFIKGASVKAKILEQKRDKKIIVFKKNRRKKYRRTAGHRQYCTVVEITKISTAA